MILRFRCPSTVELLLLAVWAAKLELFGYKSDARAAQSRLGRASERGQDSQVRQVGLVWLSELWESLGNCLTSAQLQVRSEVKVYLAEKSYD